MSLPPNVSLDLKQAKPRKIFAVKLHERRIGQLVRVDEHTECVTTPAGDSKSSPDRVYLLRWLVDQDQMTTNRRITDTISPSPWD